MRGGQHGEEVQPLFGPRQQPRQQLVRHLRRCPVLAHFHHEVQQRPRHQRRGLRRLARRQRQQLHRQRTPARQPVHTTGQPGRNTARPVVPVERGAHLLRIERGQLHGQDPGRHPRPPGPARTVRHLRQPPPHRVAQPLVVPDPGGGEHRDPVPGPGGPLPEQRLHQLPAQRCVRVVDQQHRAAPAGAPGQPPYAATRSAASASTRWSSARRRRSPPRSKSTAS